LKGRLPVFGNDVSQLVIQHGDTYTTGGATKIILLAIALGLWANVSTLLLRPATAIAQDGEVLRYIRADVASLERIARGTCPNPKIC